MKKNLLPYKGQLSYQPSFFSEKESKQYFENLTTTIKWEQKPIKIFGKEVLQPRLTAWYGDPDAAYTYSGLSLVPLSWTDALLEIRKKVEVFCSEKFNSALLNLYRNGQDSMGWHCDNERQLGKDPTIASVSLGAVRKFRLRNYQIKKDIIDLEPADGSLIIMSGETQTHWEHSVPKTSMVVGPRINITFRRIIS
jgi:alkylated DNA repair dioxygenase AlkB